MPPPPTTHPRHTHTHTRAPASGPRRCADFVILNKTDLLGEAEQEELAAIVASLNPLAQVFKCEQGRVSGRGGGGGGCAAAAGGCSKAAGRRGARDPWWGAVVPVLCGRAPQGIGQGRAVE